MSIDTVLCIYYPESLAEKAHATRMQQCNATELPKALSHDIDQMLFLKEAIRDCPSGPSAHIVYRR